VTICRHDAGDTQLWQESKLEKIERMAKIRVLPEHLVNKIAAGEVVERPASVLKELLENSLDAGALRIVVEIEDGGKKLIRISDDGVGINGEDLQLSVAPHATSKVAQERDLYEIGTFGFRGEALASIASVSRLEIVSRRHETNEGARLVVEGGQMQPVAPAAAAPGTIISVSNLFFNTPARRKFLRTPNTEMGHISEQFTRIALAHREAYLSLSHNGRLLYELPAGQSLRERIGILFSAEMAEGLIPISRKDRGIEVMGLIAPPQQSRSGAQWQYIFLNNRHIRDRFVGHAIREAYRGLLEINRQPVVFTFLQLEPRMVDVNVHPAKTEVRFADSNAIHTQVLAAIRDRLLSTDLSVTYKGEKNSPTTSDGNQPELPGAQAEETETERQGRVRQAMADFFKNAPAPGQSPPPPNQVTPPPGAGIPTSGRSSDSTGYAPTGSSSRFDAPMSAPAPPDSSIEAKQLPRSYDPSGERLEGIRPFVQIHNTYLVSETEDGLLIVDQHALHERVIYEKLHQQHSTGPLVSQGCLIPETIDVTAEQMAAVENAVDLLKELGIVVEPFGPSTLAIQSFPLLLDKVSPGEFVKDLIDTLQSQSGQTSREELLHKVLDMMACKAAVKAGDALTDEEIQNLLAQRGQVERSSNCPHGRPTTVRLSLEQLQKEFKRT